jgi:hypothetical protein
MLGYIWEPVRQAVAKPTWCTHRGDLVACAAALTAGAAVLSRLPAWNQLRNSWCWDAVLRLETPVTTNYQFGDVYPHCSKVPTAGGNMDFINRARGAGWA